MNKRLHPRRAVALHLRVYDQEHDTFLGRIGDISNGGMLLYGSQVLETGLPYTLRIDYTNEDGTVQALILSARAIWSGPDFNPAFIATGLRLLDLDKPEHRSALDLLLSKLTVERDEQDN